MHHAPTPPRLSLAWRRSILAARLIVFLIAFSIALWGAFRLFFPVSIAIFNFDKPGSLANTFFNPRDENGGSLANGQLDSHQTLVTTTGLNGTFSSLHLTLTPSRKSLDPTGTTATLRRSFTSFFFPIDPTPATFPVGTLLTSEGRYALIDADGRRIDFNSLSNAENLGYNPNAFIPVSSEEFSLNQTSDFFLWHKYDISPQQENPYPTGTLFAIDGSYYQLQDTTTLARFVSENAYLSRYEKSQAIPKTPDFLKDFTVNENWIGFRSGSLLSFGDGIFVIDGDLLRPISNPNTFVSLGFDWNQVIPASEEELGIYQRGKIVLASDPQPEGTIFVDQDTTQAFVVTADQKRQPIGGAALQVLLTRHTTPIVVSSRALTRAATCTLEPHGFFWARTYDCDAALDVLAALPGTAYELTLHAPRTGIRFNTLEASFATFVRTTTIHETLASLKQQILKRYSSQ